MHKDTQHEDDLKWMRKALELAKEAEAIDEVPVGCVIVQDGDVISESGNLRERSFDVSGHAEIMALRKAGESLSSWRMPNATAYVTLEPCLMCAGAIQQSRIKRVVFAARDPKTGAVASLYQVFDDSNLNHIVEWEEGVLAEDSSLLLKSFFKRKRSYKLKPQE